MEHGAAVEGIAAIAAQLEHSALGAAMRESLFLYPLMNLLHIFGLILLVGAIGLLDLRVLGWARDLPLKLCSYYLTPIALIGLGMMLGSGFLIFSADAGPLSASTIFRVKLLVIVAALVNAGLFRLAWSRRLGHWNDNAPPVARAQAGLSLLLWFSAATAGRLIGYG
ncbi:hypothetical protein [Dongia sp.]|uniref:hypothetical protein n=1 Tax=Dongia sp. TaxID=1977262 RepID=UPI0035B48444